jgi:lysophospholipase L1-like esterase
MPPLSLGPENPGKRLSYPVSDAASDPKGLHRPGGTPYKPPNPGNSHMKTLLCYGDSNTHGSLPSADPANRPRLGPNERWPGIVRKRLGEAWFVVEEGLGGRTTVHSDPIEGAHKNGLAGLPIALESHRPIDLVVLMLGTNDLKVRFAVSAADIAKSIAVLIDFIRASAINGPGRKRAPEVLLVAPPPALDVSDGMETRAGGAAKSQRFAALFADLAKTYGIPFLDAGSVIRSSPIDGVHFDADAHARLGNAIADKILSL